MPWRATQSLRPHGVHLPEQGPLLAYVGHLHLNEQRTRAAAASFKVGVPHSVENSQFFYPSDFT